jgi:signal transduction histidine kinase
MKPSKPAGPRARISSMFRRLPRPPRFPLVIALLALTLVVASALAWQAHQAARSHRASAERVLHDYAEFAGWEFSRVARRELDTAFQRWLEVVTCAAQSDALPDPGQLATRDGCRCDDLVPRVLFRLALADDRLTTSGETLDEDDTRAIRAAIQPAVARRSVHGPRLVRVIPVGGRAAIVAAQSVHGPGNTRSAIAGFVADPAALAGPLGQVVKKSSLLPPTLAGDSTGLLGIRVTTRTGVPVFASGAPEVAARAGGTLDETVGGLDYEIAVGSEAAARLVMGGLPRSRLPVLLGLLALTVVLVAVAVRQLRREHELTRLRADFVSSVSHELRTPLAQIRLFSETLLLGRVRSEAEGRRSLEIIQQESRRLTHLVDNVLYFSRSERGAGRLAPAPAPLAALASELVEAFAPLARSGRSELRLDVKESVVAPVDDGAVRQILLNLLDNAVKYGRPGQTVVITVDRRDAVAVLSVEDEGDGVPFDARDRIWEPYARLAPAAASAIAGAGIGLAVVRELTHLHGGSCRVEDSPRGGARFVIELPGAEPAVEAPALLPHDSQAMA